MASSTPPPLLVTTASAICNILCQSQGSACLGKATEKILAKRAALKRSEDDRQKLRVQRQQQSESNVAELVKLHAEADQFRSAADLDKAVQGKKRNEAKIREAENAAMEAERNVAAAEQEHASKEQEYQKAVAAEEAAIKRFTDEVAAAMQTQATSRELQDHNRVQVMEAGQHLQTVLLDYKNVIRTMKMAELSHPEGLNSVFAGLTGRLVALEGLLPQLQDYLSQLRDEEGRMPTGPSGCTQAKHVVSNIVHAFMA